MRVLTSVPVALLLLLSACGDESPTEPSPPACSFTLSASSLTFSAAGGTSTIGVTTASQCTWSAAADRSWMSVTSGLSGSGNGSVSIRIEANPGADGRSGTLTIADQRVSITEEGLAPCSIDLPVTEAIYGEHPRAGTFEVRAAGHCAWTATARDSWIEITSGGSGSGNGVVAYAIDRNRETVGRTGRITVNDRTFTITQAAAAAACDYVVAPVTIDVCMSTPVDLSTMVTTQPGCPWTATADAAWINILAGNSASGTGAVTFRVGDNWDDPRSGLIMVRWPTVTAGQNVRIAQAGCRYGVSTTAISVPAAGGSAAFDVLQQSDPISCGGALQDRCLWSAQTDAPWLRITTPMPRTGDDRVTFTADPNLSGVTRTGTIVVRTQMVRVTQPPN
jgi:hypothetical protein